MRHTHNTHVGSKRGYSKRRDTASRCNVRRLSFLAEHHRGCACYDGGIVSLVEKSFAEMTGRFVQK